MDIGAELQSPGPAWLLRNGALLVALPLHQAMAWWLTRRRTLARETWLFLGIQSIVTVGMLFVQRTVEYASPFAVLSAALLWREWLAAGYGWHLPGWKRYIAWAVPVSTVTVLLLLVPHWQTQQRWRLPYTAFATWARAHLPRGVPVANLVWGDFPMLWCAAPEYRSLMGLDPMFSVAHDPARMQRLGAFLQGHEALTPLELSHVVEARIAFVQARMARLGVGLLQQGFVLVWHGPEGWVFDLQAP